MIEVKHHRGTYLIRFMDEGELLQDLPPESFVITDANVDAVLRPAEPKLVLPPGESSKDLETFGRCLSWLASCRASRRATVVALGGGVIGDLAGFVAATYMRGVRLLQIPTTLLAQVDSSVGGKVAIDLPEGKNLAGAFLPPSEVRIAPDVLRHLPPRQVSNGMAEVIKYGFILDADLLAGLDLHPSAAIIERCVRLKADVVEADEFETTGLRAILNFGHTVAHALEVLTGYGDVLHGEAVAIGMVVEARLGERLGITPAGTSDAVRAVNERCGLPCDHPRLRDTEAMIAAMHGDKKAVAGRLAFSLLTQVGECKLVEGVEEDAVSAALIDLR